MSANGADLYFDIHNTEGLGAHVDVGKTRVDSFIEVSKAGHKPHRPYFMTASARSESTKRPVTYLAARCGMGWEGGSTE